MSVFTKEPLRIINGYVMHIGLFVVIFLLAPHIEVFKSVLGVGWPHMASGVVDSIAAITLLSLVVALVLRLNTKTLRYLSTPGDYWAWLVTFLPVLTGYMAFNHMLLSYTTMLALHILSVELLMITAPFNKLTHMFSFALARWYQGYQAGHRGIES
jgi:nitrate reductase gamma subunit